MAVGTAYGITTFLGPAGEVVMEGTPSTANRTYDAYTAELGLDPGKYTLSCYGTSSHDICFAAITKPDHSTRYSVASGGGSVTFDVAEGETVRGACRKSAEEGYDAPERATFWPMLVARAEAGPYSEYDRGAALMPNLWRETPSSTVNGVTFAVAADGSVSVSGTPTADFASTLAADASLPAGTYTVSCAGATAGTYVGVRVTTADGEVRYASVWKGAPTNLTVEEGSRCACYAHRTKSGGDTGDQTLWPSLVAGAKPQAFVPYQRGGGL